MPGDESRWTTELLDRKRQLCDEVADGPVATVFESGGVRAVNEIMKTLVRSDQMLPAELPDELESYLNETLAMPDWADERKIARGQRLFETWGVQISLCLFCASLPASYAAAKGVKVLEMTARLDTEPRRRIMETGQFVMDVLSVGGLDDDGKGRRAIQKVRLMHAAVRHLIRARDEIRPGLWNPQWGRPINQEDLAGTQMTFSWLVLRSLPRLGVPLSREDVDAYLHLWNVVGYLLGIAEDMRVRDFDDASALAGAIRRRQFAASPEGRAMTSALLTLLDEMTPGYLFDDTLPPLIRLLIGDDVADIIGVPRSDMVDDFARLARVTDWLQDALGADRDNFVHAVVSRWAHPFGRLLLHSMFAQQRGGLRADFAIPDHLARRWEMPPRR